jgi:acyl carrier protein
MSNNFGMGGMHVSLLLAVSGEPVSPIAEQINAILAREFEVAEEELTPGASIRDTLALDSLDAVDLTVMLQEQTGVRVEARVFSELSTLGELHQLVEALVAKTAD